jgi:hypothetical protein
MPVLLVALTACARPRKGDNEAPTPTAVIEVRPGDSKGVAAEAEKLCPQGFVTVEVAGVYPTPSGNAVFLVHGSTARAVPIFIGDTEALSIDLRLRKQRHDRPLTHDLLDSMLHRLGGQIESVRVERVEDDVFYGIVVLRRQTERVEFDARSSDAVALAVGNEAPIFMSKDVLESAGMDLEKMLEPDEPPDNPSINL